MPLAVRDGVCTPRQGPGCGGDVHFASSALESWVCAWAERMCRALPEVAPGSGAARIVGLVGGPPMSARRARSGCSRLDTSREPPLSHRSSRGGAEGCRASMQARLPEKRGICGGPHRRRRPRAPGRPKTGWDRLDPAPPADSPAAVAALLRVERALQPVLVQQPPLSARAGAKASPRRASDTGRRPREDSGCQHGVDEIIADSTTAGGCTRCSTPPYPCLSSPVSWRLTARSPRSISPGLDMMSGACQRLDVNRIHELDEADSAARSSEGPLSPSLCDSSSVSPPLCQEFMKVVRQDTANQGIELAGYRSACEQAPSGTSGGSRARRMPVPKLSFSSLQRGSGHSQPEPASQQEDGLLTHGGSSSSSSSARITAIAPSDPGCCGGEGAGASAKLGNSARSCGITDRGAPCSPFGNSSESCAVWGHCDRTDEFDSASLARTASFHWRIRRVAELIDEVQKCVQRQSMLTETLVQDPCSAQLPLESRSTPQRQTQQHAFRAVPYLGHLGGTPADKFNGSCGSIPVDGCLAEDSDDSSEESIPVPSEDRRRPAKSPESWSPSQPRRGYAQGDE